VEVLPPAAARAQRRRQRWGGLAPYLIKVEAEEETGAAVAPSAPVAAAAGVCEAAATVSTPVIWDFSFIFHLSPNPIPL
jgi:hypothetical protein